MGKSVDADSVIQLHWATKCPNKYNFRLCDVTATIFFKETIDSSLAETLT